MKPAIVILVFGAVFLAMTGLAAAYAVQGRAGAPSGVNLPQVSTGTFNVNWGQFLNDLPVQSFVNNLQSAGQSITSGAQPITAGSTAFAMPQGGQQVLAGIDNWTMAHLGFRFSTIFMGILGVLSWILGLAKSIVDWLIHFLS